jgi:hypothetical protein
MSRALVVPAVIAAVLAAGCGGSDDEPQPAPSPAASLTPGLPAELSAACHRLVAGSDITVLCPPASAGGAATLDLVHEDLDPEPCGYLVELLANPRRPTGAAPSHVVFGGRCEPLPLGGHSGRWEVDPLISLRLVANPPLESGKQPRIVQPHVLGPFAVRGHDGLLLRSDPFPEGGFHGGAYAVVWNERGAGYAVSLRFPRGERGQPPGRAELRELRRFAASLSPAS